MLPAFFVSYYNHVQRDPRIGPGLQRTAEHIRSQWSGPHIIGNDPRYVQGSYGERDPSLVNPAQDALVGERSSSLHYPYMNCHFMAWKYAYDGDTDARNVWDTMMSTPNPDIASPKYKTRKLTGQVFAMAFHGAAWRAGAPALGL